MSRISAVLLAAGESRRMRGLNKVELPVQGVPLLRRSAMTLLAAPLAELIVVLGHESTRALALLHGLPVATVFNEDYRQGQMTSVHKGLDALTLPCDGVMVCLTDQPLLDVGDIHTIVTAFDRRTRGGILIPTYRGVRGNPIVLAWSHRDAILRSGRNLGCKQFIERNADWVEAIEMANDHVVTDLDTPEDYAEMQRRVGAPRGQPATASGGTCTESTASSPNPSVRPQTVSNKVNINYRGER